MKIYDVQGKEVISLVEENLNSGTYEITLPGGNLPSGTYFYKLESLSSKGIFSEVKKMVLIK